MRKTYIEIAEFVSRSQPGKVYKAKEDEEGNLSCSCPAWIFKKPGQSRGCRHLEELARHYGPPLSGITRRIWLDQDSEVVQGSTGAVRRIWLD